VTGSYHCQLSLSHSINTSLESVDPCFQELGPSSDFRREQIRMET